MHQEVKKSADAGDVKDLKYTFVDSLDVDPTFEEYLDDYNYCASKGLFERHKDLTPFADRQADWNDNYWGKIKRDLLKNFSRERLDHMRKVALVVNAEKVARLQKERQTAAQPVTPKFSQPTVAQRSVTPPQLRAELPTKSKAQQQQEKLDAAKRQLAQENAQVERQQLQQQQQQQQLQRQQQLNQQTADDSSKKVWGIAAIAVAAVIIFVLLK